MAAPHQPRYNLEDPGSGFEPRNARDAREAARAARNGQSPRYRRPQSPDGLDEYRFQSEEGSEMRSPTSDVALQDAMLAQAQQQQQVSFSLLSFRYLFPLSISSPAPLEKNRSSLSNIVSPIFFLFSPENKNKINFLAKSVSFRLVRLRETPGSADNHLQVNKVQVPTSTSTVPAVLKVNNLCLKHTTALVQWTVSNNPMAPERAVATDVNRVALPTLADRMLNPLRDQAPTLSRAACLNPWPQSSTSSSAAEFPPTD